MGLATGSLMGLATLTVGWLGFTATQQPTAAAQTPSLDTRVTASMTNASMDEVLQWLRRTGVNFVIDKNNSPKDAQLNLNIVDKPLKDVMEAIASAVGGSWQKHGEIYSLRRGGAFGFGTPAPDEDIIRVFPPANMDEMRAWEKEIAPKIGELGEWHKEFEPKLREHLKGLEAEMAPRIEGQLLVPREHMELPEKLEGLRFHMLDEAQVKELIKSTTPKQKELMKSRGHLVPEDLNAKQRELLRSMGDIHGTMRLKVDDAEIIIKGPKGDMLHDEVIIAPRIGGVPAPPAIPHGGELMPPPMAPRVEPGTPAAPPHGRWKELTASLTGDQRAQMKKQGFIYEDQLTAAQRRLVSLPQDASYTLTISNGRASITIKSRK